MPDTVSSEETQARFRLRINTTTKIPVTEKRNGRTYIGLSSNAHLKVVSPHLKCFCTVDVSVAVSDNSNTGAAGQLMGFARTISISSQSVSAWGLRSRNYPYLLSGRHWFYILDSVRK